jgi:hypothetical protein
MSSPKKYAAPLRLEPRFSPRLAALLALALAGALLLPWLAALPAGWRVAAFLLAFILAWPGWRDAFGRRRITRAVWDELGAWQLELADGTATEAELEGGSFVAPAVMVLGFRTGVGRHHLVVLADTLDAETRRRLRVRLRLEGARSAGNGKSGDPPG